jgi:hypothetical protein
MNETTFLSEQFLKLFTTFKCYKVYWLNDQEEVCHKIKSHTIKVLHSFYDIENELDRFHPHEIGFISFFMNIVSYYHQI